MSNRYTVRRSALPRPAVCRASPPPPDPSPFALYTDAALFADFTIPANGPFQIAERKLVTHYPAGPDILAFHFGPLPSIPGAPSRASVAYLPGTSPVIPNLTLSITKGTWRHVQSYSVPTQRLDPLELHWIDLPLSVIPGANVSFFFIQIAGMVYPH